MVIVKAYIKVAKTKTNISGIRYLVEASSKKPLRPKLLGSEVKKYPTISFAVNFDIPDSKFEEAERVIATIPVRSEDVEIVTEVERRDEAV